MLGQLDINSSVKVIDSGHAQPIQGATVLVRGTIPGQNPVTLLKLLTDANGNAILKSISAEELMKHGELGAKLTPENLSWAIYANGYQPHLLQIIPNVGEDQLVALKAVQASPKIAKADLTPWLILGGIAVVVGYNYFFNDKK